MTAGEEVHRRRTAASGLYLVDKPVGPTTMDCCRRVKHALIEGGLHKSIKVGHGGTLDPLASGLVVVLVGRATRQCDAVMAGAKRYLADVDLSITSTTGDLEGATTPVAVGSPPTREQVERAAAAFVGVVQQQPPAYSAMWVGGKRAYDLARRGRAPDLKPRPVRIDAITVIDYAWPRLRLDITCGKGTYIRALARDLGASLGAGGCLVALRRTAIGDFDVARAVRYDAVPPTLSQNDLLPMPS
jgi:tRNA pseudouridine55 synthase